MPPPEGASHIEIGMRAPGDWADVAASRFAEVSALSIALILVSSSESDPKFMTAGPIGV